jgi:long-chain fatty acid transport protein
MSTKRTNFVKTNHTAYSAGAICLSALALALISSQTSFGLGIALPDQDAFATARGNAFVATADDPAAVFYNPAGISQLEGMNVSVGAYGIVYSDTYHGATTSADSRTQLAVLPQVFSTYSLPQYHLTLGLGTYSPYGLRMEWPSSAPFTAAGQTGEIDYYTLNPVIAYQILPSLSIAAGPTLNYSEADLKETFGPFVDHFRGRDTDLGYTVGVLWHPLDQHSFGVNYRSATDMHYDGHATVPVVPFNANGPAAINFHFPQTVSMGYSFRPTTNWNFEVDADWSDWSDLRTVTVTPYSENLPFNWHPSWMFDFGATRYIGDGWRISGGYMYSMDSVPEADFNALVPDSDRHIFSAGIGKTYKHFRCDLAYQFAWGPSRTIGTDNNALADGRYQFTSHAISINFGYRF